MSDLLEVTGTVQGITEKPNGWSEVAVNIGRQYPVKLSTKLPSLLEDVRALGTSEATFRYSESESQEINPHSGQPYKNRRLEAVLNSAVTPSAGPAGERAAALTAPPQATPSQPIATGVLDKDRSIVRQCCIKAVGALYEGSLSTTLSDQENDAQVLHVLRAAAIMERWVYRDGSAA